MKQLNSTSVQRTSDGVIFNIGDKIVDNLVQGGAPITGFDKDGDLFLIVTDYGACTINQATKI